MTKRKTTKEAEAKTETKYWATERTKIYPEKEFTKTIPTKKLGQKRNETGTTFVSFRIWFKESMSSWSK
jgi:hypothetical protein